MGNNCCVNREKQSDINKESKSSKKAGDGKKKPKNELEKYENEETAQTIEFRVDTDGSADMMDMKSNKRLSQLSDRLSDKKEKKSDIVHIEDIKPVVQDPLFSPIQEEQEINFESVKKGQKADRSAKPHSKITPVLSDRKTTITKVE